MFALEPPGLELWSVKPCKTILIISVYQNEDPRVLF